jgi:hypothetical protein
MEHLPRSRLLDCDQGRHYASEPHLRIQVLRIPGARNQPAKEPLFGNYHGEVLVVALQGRCRVEAATSTLDLGEHDQALLLDGEPFRIVGVVDDEAVVELVWTPGMNPCRTCWEREGRFFGGGAAG